LRLSRLGVLSGENRRKVRYRDGGPTIAIAFSQLNCEGSNDTNFEDERGGGRRRGSNRGKLELGTRYANVVVANQRTIPTKCVFPESESAAETTTAMAVFYSNLEMETEDSTVE
jgi:hypothetical protein